MTHRTREQPNIVLIMADQWTYDTLGAMGNDAIRTPHIDALTGGGVLFDRCYCNSPLCVPARGCLMTGRHAGRISMFDNASELAAGTPTFVHHLRRCGYDTVLTGKMHFVGPDQFHGFEKRLLTDIYPATFALTPDWSRGVYANPGSSVARITDSGPCAWNVQLEYDEEVLHTSLQYLRSYATDESRHGEPLFLCASFTHPHDPFEITAPYWDLYDGVDIPLPRSAAKALPDMHPYERWIQAHHETAAYPLSEDQIRRARRGYYGMVSYFDHAVGTILHELALMNMLENTVVIVTSDHGEMLGEHGMWFKRTFHENAVRVPLIVSWPGTLPAGSRRDEVVSLVDLAATILDLAGVPDTAQWIDRMDGDSFRELLGHSLDAPPAPGEWKDEAFCEYYGEGPIEPFAMLRRGRWKYVAVNREAPLLFDLESDPCETMNRATDPAHSFVREQMAAEVDRRVDLQAMSQRVRESQQERLMVHEALTTGEPRLWALENRFFV